MGLDLNEWAAWLAQEPRIGLGTVQLGISYGVANRDGLPSEERAQSILRQAWGHGIRFYDTARGYGQSEKRLGVFFRSLDAHDPLMAISKLSGREADAEAVMLQIRESCALLGRPPWGMMLHAESSLDEWAGRWKELFWQAKNEGLIAHAGVSVYTVEGAMKALNLEGVDIIQVPGNIYDRRMLRANIFTEAIRSRKAVFVRSVYLQGLVGQDATGLSAGMAFAGTPLNVLNRFCVSNHVSPRLFALAYALKRFESALPVLGAETEEQVDANCRMVKESGNVSGDLMAEWDAAWPNDISPLIDPRVWP